MINLPDTKLCHLEFQNEWLTISLDNHKKRNALSSELIDELIEVLDLARDEKVVRGILIKGQNDIFCSGADLDELHQITYNKSQSKKMTIDMSTKIGQLLNLIDSIPKLTVSVIEGPCIAGGFGMACATDVIITMHDSVFRLSETRLGLTPSQIAPYVLRKVDYSKARLLMLLGDSIDGKIAYDIGLADYLATTEKEVQDHIDKLKSKLNKCSPNAFAITKSLVSKHASINIQEAADLFYECVEHSQGKEGLESFFEKRSPFWVNNKNKS